MAGKFDRVWRVSRSHVAASAVAGPRLGCGARLGYGCNMGAFFSGIASGNLYVWLWIACLALHLDVAESAVAFGLSDAAPPKGRTEVEATEQGFGGDRCTAASAKHSSQRRGCGELKVSRTAATALVWSLSSAPRCSATRTGHGRINLASRSSSVVPCACATEQTRRPPARKLFVINNPDLAGCPYPLQPDGSSSIRNSPRCCSTSSPPIR